MSVQHHRLRDAQALPLSTQPSSSISIPRELRRRRKPDAAPGAPAAQTEWIATIAHELRSPLTTLQATLELLVDSSDLDPEYVRELVRRLQGGVSWMNGLIENLATSAALADGRLVLRRTPAGVHEWIEPAVTLMEPILARRRQRLRLICPMPAPVVSGDTLRLGQVLVNLLSNACRYGAWGDVIDLTVTIEHGQASIRVTDHGEGVPVEKQEAVFGRFVRGDGAERAAAEGQGLGLHIVRQLVELHGGAVGVDSTPGRGATFWFSLPLSPDA